MPATPRSARSTSSTPSTGWAARRLRGRRLELPAGGDLRLDQRRPHLDAGEAAQGRARHHRPAVPERDRRLGGRARRYDWDTGADGRPAGCCTPPTAARPGRAWPASTTAWPPRCTSATPSTAGWAARTASMPPPTAAHLAARRRRRRRRGDRRHRPRSTSGRSATASWSRTLDASGDTAAPVTLDQHNDSGWHRKAGDHRLLGQRHRRSGASPRRSRASTAAPWQTGADRHRRRASPTTTTTASTRSSTAPPTTPATRSRPRASVRRHRHARTGLLRAAQERGRHRQARHPVLHGDRRHERRRARRRSASSARTAACCAGSSSAPATGGRLRAPRTTGCASSARSSPAPTASRCGPPTGPATRRSTVGNGAARGAQRRAGFHAPWWPSGSGGFFAGLAQHVVPIASWARA